MYSRGYVSKARRSPTVGTLGAINADILRYIKNDNMTRAWYILLILTTWTKIVQGQCNVLFSFSAYFEEVAFVNQSTVSNAHYFWNFGDGTGSNYKNPIHKFPETGTYLVSLYAKDTISNCSNLYEFWVTTTKFSLDPCKSEITDSLFITGGNHFVKVIDKSVNCNSYIKYADGGSCLNYQISNPLNLHPTIPFRMVLRARYYDNLFVLKRLAYKSSLHNYMNNKHYTPCSANFEFTTVSQDTANQRILFKAMNAQANSYAWYIDGLTGGPYTNDTVSVVFPKKPLDLWTAVLITTGQSGCIDTLYQNIRLQDSASVYTIEKIDEFRKDISFKVYPNPFVEQTVIEVPIIYSNATLSIFDNLGNVVRETIETNNKFIVNRNELISGLYFFILKDDQNKIIASGKLIVL
jgi:PKD repeat protein